MLVSVRMSWLWRTGCVVDYGVLLICVEFLCEMLGVVELPWRGKRFLGLLACFVIGVDIAVSGYHGVWVNVASI